MHRAGRIDGRGLPGTEVLQQFAGGAVGKTSGLWHGYFLRNSTQSTSWAAVSPMPRTPHEGENPRRLQEKATSFPSYIPHILGRINL